MHSVHESANVVWIVTGEASVAQVRDVSNLVGSIRSKHLAHLRSDDFRGSKEREGVHVALQRDAASSLFSYLRQVARLINGQGIEGQVRQLFNDGVCTLGEANDGRVGTGGLDLFDDNFQGRNAVLAVETRGNKTSP